VGQTHPKVEILRNENSKYKAESKAKPYDDQYDYNGDRHSFRVVWPEKSSEDDVNPKYILLPLTCF
jgi:hypothetical protein